MTRRDRLIKNLLFAVVLVYYLGGYFLINEFTARRVSHFHLTLPLEEGLPFFPALIFAYLLVFGFLALIYLAIDDLPFFKKVIRAFLLCVSFHFAVFLIFPVEYVLRPAVDPDQGWAYLLVHFYYWLDLPYNCFPSMHISNAFLVAFLMNRYRPGLGWILFPLAILVAASVVLVKQHYIADVVAGFFVGWGVFRVIGLAPASKTLFSAWIF